MDAVSVKEDARFERASRWPSMALLGSAMAIGIGFVAIFALPYFTLNPEVFRFYWPRRGWLLLHIGGGMVALLTGP
jgi:hypothetical protein